MSPLVESGVLAASDWEMAGVPLASRGAAIDRLRASSRSLVECRVMDARLGLKGAERAILLAFAGPIASLLVEMAIASMSNDAMLAAVAESASRSRRRREGAFYDPGDLLMKSALHADPRPSWTMPRPALTRPRRTSPGPGAGCPTWASNGAARIRRRPPAGAAGHRRLARLGLRDQGRGR